ncbi:MULTISPECIES: MerR family transcriptional regulator [Halomonas]|uniref:MerR family transcriptional regulator n=2 Tax=Halomonas TaxID=2745 RepID=A0ABQ0U6K2_9GAMM|nr:MULTISPECIES: MerR family DNA-binding transcriptional regulator [Halomonas]PSJ23312.1 MerR family DNA-binding transcriptional regulator [Halomonas sp. ND22Bw]KGE79158.1 MerR family transcriptional regulator [Halomonas salina]MDR5890928.1 MerR family DNA-binding transcriptional regulator [Halomonas salina]RAH38180.1 MerR family transcriptional regulator [Halomonas sp. SL1]WJY05912.1 MerR family DNA-binding transcriptional regulator [Halomonas halophila]
MTRTPSQAQDSENDALPRQQRTYTIGELAQIFEVTPRTIRFYEQEGLLAPTRQGQKRIYREKDRVRLKLTLRGKRLGFSLAEIREVVMMYDAMPDGNARQLRRLLELLAEKRANLERQLEDIRLMRLEIDDVDQRAREVLRQLEDTP